MLRQFLLVILVVIVCGGLNCSPPGRFDDDNALVPRRWAQIQGDEESTGFNAVSTTYSLAPLRRWTADVGPTAFCSPVIGPDGRIWIGNVAGEIVGTSPDGVVTDRRQVGGSILSSPAVDNEGFVYVLSQAMVGDELASTLHKFDPSNGQLISNSVGPAFRTLASPKFWGDYILVPANLKILVFNRSDLSPVAEADTFRCFLLVCGSSDLPGWADFILNVSACIATVTLADPIGIANCYSDFDEGGTGNGVFIEPSAAIVDQPALVDDVNRPTVVVATNQCLNAFAFDPSAPADSRLTMLWTKAMVPVDCDFKTVRPTTPAVLVGGLVVVGNEKGRVRAYDLHDGSTVWTYEADEPVQSPPVASLRQIYVTTSHHLVVLDNDGEELDKIPLQGPGGGAALSLSFVHVTTTQGIHSFGLEPAEAQSFDGSIVASANAGATVPAIGEDGTVYVVTSDGLLHAYGTGLLALPLVVPSIAWTAPPNGGSISYSAGQTLEVSLGPAGFTGMVAIASNVDGSLGKLSLLNATSGMIMTTRRLTLGTHVLTAFATEKDGGQRSAQTTIKAVNAPPVVQITMPADNASLFNNMVAMSAQVSDADEGTIPADRIEWTSSLDGALGSGATLNATLSVGTHTLTCTAIDELGAETSDSVSATVNPPIP